MHSIARPRSRVVPHDFHAASLFIARHLPSMIALRDTLRAA
jgi:hypothetical protein